MKKAVENLIAVLNGYVGPVLSRSIILSSVETSGVSFESGQIAHVDKLLDHINIGLSIYVTDLGKRRECFDRLKSLLAHARPSQITDHFHEGRYRERVDIVQEADILKARRTARQFGGELGFSPASSVKIATAISELARNIVRYAGKGYIEVVGQQGDRPYIEISAVDNGPGISDISDILGGTYHSNTGLGLGIVGTKRLMDEFQITSSPGKGTTVKARMYADIPAKTTGRKRGFFKFFKGGSAK